ncbi:cellulose synthase, partial [Escherichia coli]
MNIKKNLLYHKLLVLPILTLFVIFISLIEQPLTFYQQTLFSSIMCLAVLLINFRKGKFITLFLMGVGILISSRYIFWRISTTLIWDKYPDIFFSLTLLIAEIYAWAVLLLGYFQVCFPLNRESLPLPADPTHWPSVDIFIPTYNEPLSVVQNTV